MQLPGGCGDKLLSISKFCALCSAQTTRVHPTLKLLLQDRAGQAQSMSRSVLAVALLFFNPVGDAVGRYCEGALKTSKRTSFFIGAQDLLRFLLGITIWLGIFATAPSAVITAETLFAVGSETITNNVFTLAVIAFKNDCDHKPKVYSLSLVCATTIVWSLLAS